MEFNGQYLTYEEYNNLGGTGLTLMPFNLLEFEARKRIDGRTLNRLKNVDSKEIPKEVKICEYKLITSIQKYAEEMHNVASNNGIASENIDGYSVSYITPDRISDIVKSKEVEIDDIIRTSLLYVSYNGEHLLYIG